MAQRRTTSPCGVSEHTVNSSDLLVAFSALEADMRALKTIVIVFCVLAWPVAMASADEVMLKNGDRLSGDILKMGEGILVLKTTYAGEVKIDWRTSRRSRQRRPSKSKHSTGRSCRES